MLHSTRLGEVHTHQLRMRKSLLLALSSCVANMKMLPLITRTWGSARPTLGNMRGLRAATGGGSRRRRRRGGRSRARVRAAGIMEGGEGEG
jgi:hypothetical protein